MSAVGMTRRPAGPLIAAGSFTMTDTAAPETATDAQAPKAPPIVFQGQYIKDLSFEVPGAPGVYSRMNQAPEIPISIDVQAQKLQDNFYEVTLHITVNAKLGEEPAFILELVYGSVVQITPEQPDHLQPLLFIEAPRTIFPFVRNIIADTTRDGGFPPLLLQPIDFVALYRQRLEAAARQAQQEQTQ